MKKLFLASLALLFSVTEGISAVPQQRRGTTSTTSTGATSNTTSRTNSVTARSATTVRSSVPQASSTTSTTARSATSGRTTVNRSGTTNSSSTPAVSARAASTQKVIGTGTKVASATENVIVSESCRQKYMGCMDSFCMLDNASGGRCICSDKNAELDSILAEIEKLDMQSYQMATFGVESIESGIDIEVYLNRETENSNNNIDISKWNVALSEDIEDNYDIKDLNGDKLYLAAHEICEAQIPECSSELSMLQLMYSQQIRSDCTAYENSLKQQKNSSAQKVLAAEKALRDAALEQYQNSNKYDLGQCALQFKNCMITTGGCGEDFSKCASVVASDNTNVNKSTTKGVSTYTIQGSITNIEISASTYDALLSKKPLCDSITNSCVAVREQVWDTFLKEAAPQIKSAELIAEDNARQNCIGSISDCFQQACKDNIDPKDPDGSYDMCLTRPETMLSLCKVPLNACGIDASSAEKAEESQIWDYVLARLASMRVNSCTTAVKECLQSEDRCGEDYSQCIGLDTDTIIRMCPYESLPGCQLVYGEEEIRGDAVYDELANMVQGVMLNIDNAMLTECQNAMNEAMIRVCGDTENCNNLTVDENIGARTLEYKICEYKSSADTQSLEIDYDNCKTDVAQITDTELGRVYNSTSNELGNVKPFAGVFDGVMFWENVSVDEKGHLTDFDTYLSKIEMDNVSDKDKNVIKMELGTLQSSIDSIIQTIESDPIVQYCMTGREVQGMKTSQDNTRAVINRGEEIVGRFPNLTASMRLKIANSALKTAKDNYYEKYDELNEKMMEDYVTIAERMAEIKGENAKDARRNVARISCVNLADLSTLPKSPDPPKNIIGMIIIGAIVVAATVVVTVFTAGAGAFAAAAAASAYSAALNTAVATAAATTSAAIASGTAIGTAVGTGLAAGTTASLGAASAAMLSSYAASALAAGIATGVGGGALIGGTTGQILSNVEEGSEVNSVAELSGRSEMEQFNYKETVITNFEWDSLICHKCTQQTYCEKIKNPMFGSSYCTKWGETIETCTDIQF